MSYVAVARTTEFLTEIPSAT